MRRVDPTRGEDWRRQTLFLIDANRHPKARGSEEYREGWEAALVALIQRMEAARVYRSDSEQLAKIVASIVGDSD